MSPQKYDFELTISRNSFGSFVDGDLWSISVFDGRQLVSSRDTSILWFGIFLCWIDTQRYRIFERSRLGYRERKKVNW